MMLALSALLTNVGCSNHTLGNGNGGGADMAVGGIGGNGSGGSGGSGGSAGSGGSGGSGGASGGGDMSAAMPACDVTTQMGCPSGEKCVPSFAGRGGLSAMCVPTGSVMEGQPCMPASGGGNTLNDNCAGGLICDNDGPDSANVCRRVCTADSTCTNGQRCGLLFNASYGVCLPTCTAFGTGCPAGNDCSVPFDDIAATQASEVGFFVCKKTGSVGAWKPCQKDSDCAAGLACDPQAGCFPVCDAMHACGDAPGDGGVLMCSPLVSQGNGAGYCN
jgi:hypothetical protein